VLLRAIALPPLKKMCYNDLLNQIATAYLLNAASSAHRGKTMPQQELKGI